MQPRDRRTTLVLFGTAGIAWLVAAWVLLALDPRTDPGIRYLGATAIGLAIGITTMPLFWLAGFARQRRIAYRGDWTRAIRRGAWVAGLIGLAALLRMEGLFQPQ